jgi:hypothetical protein
MIPAGYAISAEAHVLDLDQGHDAHSVITVIHVVGSGLLADFLDGNDSTLHNKSPSRIGWPTSYLMVLVYHRLQDNTSSNNAQSFAHEKAELLCFA